MKNRSARSTADRGVALTIVVVVIIMLSLLALYVTNLGYNQRKLMDSATGRRIVLYYRAQAGVVDAFWRIRFNVGGSFTNPAYSTTYNLDVDGNSVNDTQVTIGAEVSGVRPINSVGLDV